jgi:malonyl CoA-acyl carrier protein transacylase
MGCLGRYITYNTKDKNGYLETLYSPISIIALQYMLSHPSDLLFVTQIVQIGLVVTKKAAFDDIGFEGLVQPDCTFAGHSLGEYSSLARSVLRELTGCPRWTTP